MPAQLLALTDGPDIVLDKPILLVGRHAECDIQIESRKISRRHCCIAQVGSFLVVRDLDSTNGIRINGVRVVEGQLHPGDELAIGHHRYRVCLEGAPPPSPKPRFKPRPKVKEDQALESCDEPVPLMDVPLAQAAQPPLMSAPASPPASGSAKSVSAPIPPQTHPEILPDNIHLAPSHPPGLPPAASRSSHHGQPE
jgi:predicted component of type VI protein secretion system